MNYTIEKLEKFIIIGLSVQTSNLNGKALNDIGLLWQQFISSNLRSSIPNIISDDVYCLYTDYSSDWQGEYTTIIGYKVSSVDNIPANCTAKIIDEQEYNVYTSAGKIPDSIGQTWLNIWSEPDDFRSYKSDFDLYGKEAQNPNDAKVYTYLSVK